MTIKQTKINEHKTELLINDSTKITIIKDGVIILDMFQNKSVAIFPEELSDLIQCLQEAKRLIDGKLLEKLS